MLTLGSIPQKLDLICSVHSAVSSLLDNQGRIIWDYLVNTSLLCNLQQVFVISRTATLCGHELHPADPYLANPVILSMYYFWKTKKTINVLTIYKICKYIHFSDGTQL